MTTSFFAPRSPLLLRPARLMAAVLLVTAAARAQLPDYQPGEAVSGTLRMTGDDAAKAVVKLWQADFLKHHPESRLQPNLLGTGTGLAALYAGASELALMGRELTPVEHDGYKFTLGAEPLGIEVMTGSLETPGKSPALIVIVHKDNPLAHISLAQLDGVLGTEHRRGAGNLRTWGELGLTGDWAGKRIRSHVFDAKSGTGTSLNLTVLKDSSKWNWDDVCEYRDIAFNPEGFPCDAAQQIADAVAKDPYSLGVSGLRYADSRVKVLPVAASDAGPFVEPTRDTLVSRQYPLTRAVTLWVNRLTGKPVDPAVKEFLRYVLSKEGQDAVLREGQFLPLSDDVAKAQLKKLD